MQIATEALKVALRVLTAVSEKREADPADVAALRRFAPLLADGPLDELACDVIQQGLRRRAAMRASTG